MTDKLVLPEGFTPGPWSVFYAEDGAAIATANGKSFIAVWPNSLDGTPFPAEANARLIALAPSMASEITTLRGEVERLREALKNARAVIAAAPEDAWGENSMGANDPPGSWITWAVKDEILHYIDADLAALGDR